ncbi:MAG: FtsK/SpoIIIE domain-containing protein [Peptostreptococcaceae bacterium]
MENNIIGVTLKAIAEGVPAIGRILYNAYDSLGNVMYRLIEGVPYGSVIEEDDIITTDNIKMYEYIPVEKVNDIRREGDKVIFEYIEGEKEGIRACIGFDNMDTPVTIDLLDGHLLIGGMTGGGKSNLINVIITNLMLTYTRNEVFFMGCDLAASDIYYFRRYANFKEVSIDHKGFLEQVNWLEKKMKERSIILDECNCRNVVSYNSKYDKKMCYIVFIIDELTQLTDNKECKEKLHKLMSVCRKFGVYVICCGQDATKETIGKCKMNCPQVIGLRTFDDTDSDTLIGKNQNLKDLQVGQCKLRSKGEIIETQVMYISEDTIESVLKPFEKE